TIEQWIPCLVNQPHGPPAQQLLISVTPEMLRQGSRRFDSRFLFGPLRIGRHDRSPCGNAALSSSTTKSVGAAARLLLGGDNLRRDGAELERFTATQLGLGYQLAVQGRAGETR